MSMQDPLSDMCCRIMNAQRVGHDQLKLPSSKLKLAVLKILKEEGYILDYRLDADAPSKKPEICVDLKYFENAPVIEFLKRLSRPGLRSYRASKALSSIKSGLGTLIVSTSKGIMTGNKARAVGIGGEELIAVF